MNITVKIKRFVAVGSPMRFPQYDMNVWLSPAALSQLGILEAVNKRPQFIKIECKSPINRFTFYSKVASLNPNLEYEEGYVWIPSEIIHPRIIFDKKTEVEISTVNISETIVAESVTIRLKEKEVDKWSEEEVRKAVQNYKIRNSIAFMQQLVFVKPGTKSVVVGEVNSIFPRPTSFNQLFSLNNETKVVFEGLPNNQQKVIDFDQIGGLDSVIDKLREIIQLPLTCPDYLIRFGIKPPKGMLMYGPPGNGKTMIARAVAQSMGASFISIEGPELMSKYVGVGEQRLREKFEEAEVKDHSVIFIDEIDSIASIRSESSADYQISMVATLLNLMDGMKTNNVFVIGATNRLNAIDPALRRPGRFDLEFEVPLPSVLGRLDILGKYVKLENYELFDEQVSQKTLQKLADLTAGYSGADLSLLYRETAMIAIRRNIRIDHESGKLFVLAKPEAVQITENDFLEAMKTIIPTSMRDVDMVADTIAWEDLLGVDAEKSALQELHYRLEKCVDSDSIRTRPSFANFVISGIIGSGKKTIAHAFSSHFGYEYFNLDLIRLQSMSIGDAFGEIEKMFSKAKQIAPAVITITNDFEDIRSAQLWVKIYNEILMVNKRAKLFVILILNEDNKIGKYLGYKQFGAHISIPIPKEDTIKTIIEKFGVTDFNVDGYLGKPTGQIISEIQERIILNH